jgi:hypothetical protein
MKIISGGQTGVDRAALDLALSLGLPCGGWCPAGRAAEDGTIPARYPLRETATAEPDERTERNVRDADGTVIIRPGSPLQGGTKRTADLCGKHSKPLLLIDASRAPALELAAQLDTFVSQNQIEILNVAGPRASEWPQGYEIVAGLLTNFLLPPKLSFVVPAHNEENELPQTLNAVRQAAEACGESYEIIVVNDASTDATAEVAAKFGARVINIERRHIAAARNAGGRAARGELLFFVDADTQITPALLAAALQALKDGCTGGSARVLADRKPPFWGSVFLHLFATLYFSTGLGAGAFLFTRRELFEQIGGFDEQYFAGEEVFFSLALKKLGRFIILREPFITSARKLRMHSPGYVAGQIFSLCLRGRSALKTRDRLALWYDGKRERRALL